MNDKQSDFNSLIELFWGLHVMVHSVLYFIDNEFQINYHD